MRTEMRPTTLIVEQRDHDTRHLVPNREATPGALAAAVAPLRASQVVVLPDAYATSYWTWVITVVCSPIDRSNCTAALTSTEAATGPVSRSVELEQEIVVALPNMRRTMSDRSPHDDRWLGIAALIGGEDGVAPM